jgi:hypothetical protein
MRNTTINLLDPLHRPNSGVVAGSLHKPKRSRFVFATATCGLLAILGACGVPAQPNAQRIAVDRISLAVQQPERSVTSFVLVGGSKLYGRPDCIPLTLDLKRSAMAELVNLRKPLSVDDAVYFGSSVNRYDLSIDSVDATGTVTLDVSKSPSFKGDYLAIGQVVMSLSSIKGIKRVGMLERTTAEVDKVTVLASVKVAGSYDGPGIKNGELLLPASKETFSDAVESALVPFFFLKDQPDGSMRLQLSSKNVVGFDSADKPTIQAAQYLGELELGPSGETPREKEARERFVKLDAQIEQTNENGPLKLTVSKDFDALSPTDQALALGQILLTLELIPSYSELPPVQFYVSTESNANDSSGAPKPSIPADSIPVSVQRRTRVPNAYGDMVDRENLSPRDYEKLKTKEISTSRECR